MKNSNKKVLLGLTVLATPFVVENIVENNVASANATYNLTESVQVYGTAQNASKQVNSNRTYDKGTYYVYKQHNGMINISKTPGKAGAWINPATGKVVETATTKAPQPTVTTTAQPTKSVSQSTKQTDTSNQQTQQATNLSLAKPKEGQYSILKTTDAYVNAIDASKKVNAKGKVSAGNYYVFREYKGMLNVSRAQGKVGSWINPGATTIAADQKASGQVTTTPKQETVQTNTQTTQTTKPSTNTGTKTETTGYKTTNGMFAVTSPTDAYLNAIDANKKANARGKVPVGAYYIFREYRGMLNVSRAQGKAGSWINPGIVEEPKSSTTAKKEETKTNTSQTTTTNTNTTSSVINKAAGTYTLATTTEAYVNAVDASRKVNVRGKVGAGTYHIFREYKGMLNISKAQGKAGSWINPGAVVETSPAPKKEETKQNTVTNKTETKTETLGRKVNGQFVLNAATETYVSSADASRKVNARGKVGAGTYHIFREYNGMLNISKEKGKVGSWINPSATSTKETATTSLPKTNSVTKEVSGAGVKYYTQDKAPWSSKWYGLGNMHHTGCVPTSLAMAISTLGQNVSPDTIANYLYKNTNAFNKKVQGTAADGIAKVLNHYGLKYKVVNTKNGLDTELGKGNMVLSLVQGSKFITPGYTHAVIAKGLDKAGNTTVYNPYSTYGIKKFSTSTLYNSQSMDPDDRKLGGTFISIYK